MNVVDSSGWLAYFADEPNAGNFMIPLHDPAALVVPSVTIYEVFKVIRRETGENEALQAVVAMRKGTVVNLTPELAVAASKLSLELGLPMTNSIVLATAQAFDAELWTQDADFKGLPKVRYLPSKK
jgi:toxin FitB